MWGEATITIDVLDRNEMPLFSEGNALSRSVLESAGTGSSVDALIQAEDKDAGQFFQFELTHELFEIGADSGEVLVRAPLSYEVAGSHSVVVRVFDNGCIPPAYYDGCERLSRSVPLTIEVVDVNERPVLSDSESAVGEATGAEEYASPSVCAYDDDNSANPSRQSLAYSIVEVNARDARGNAAVYDDELRLANADNCMRVVVAEALLNYETVRSYRMLVSVADDGAPSLDTTAFMTVSVLDENDAPIFSDCERSVGENAAPGDPVGSELEAIDEDVANGQQAALSWAVTEGADVFGVASSAATSAQLTVVMPGFKWLSAAGDGSCVTCGTTQRALRRSASLRTHPSLHPRARAADGWMNIKPTWTAVVTWKPSIRSCRMMLPWPRDPTK